MNSLCTERERTASGAGQKGEGPDWTIRDPNRGKGVGVGVGDGVGAARRWGIPGREPVVNRAESTIAARITTHDARLMVRAPVPVRATFGPSNAL